MMEGNELKAFLRDLVEFLKANDIADFSLEQTDFKVNLKFQGDPAAAAQPGMDLERMAQMARAFAAGGAGVAAPPVVSAPAHVAHLHAQAEPAGAVTAASGAASAPAAAVPTEAKHHIVKSPIVGTLYEAPSPGSPPFVKVGDIVEVGQVLCIVEAMKLMNEIESDVAGEVMERIAQSGQPVEYGQSLFAIKAR